LFAHAGGHRWLLYGTRWRARAAASSSTVRARLLRRAVQPPPPPPPAPRVWHASASGGGRRWTAPRCAGTRTQRTQRTQWTQWTLGGARVKAQARPPTRCHPPRRPGHEGRPVQGRPSTAEEGWRARISGRRMRDALRRHGPTRGGARGAHSRLRSSHPRPEAPEAAERAREPRRRRGRPRRTGWWRGSTPRAASAACGPPGVCSATQTLTTLPLSQAPMSPSVAHVYTPRLCSRFFGRADGVASESCSGPVRPTQTP